MRTRITARGSRGILAEIKQLERILNADEDAELLDEAESVSGEEDIEGQNDRAMNNWPMSASERQALARRLVSMARRLTD